MKITKHINSMLVPLAIAVAFGASIHHAGGQTLAAFYPFEGGILGDPSDTSNWFDYAPADAFSDDLTGLYQPEVSSAVTGNAKGSMQCASFDGTSKLRTDAYTTDLQPSPNAFTVMFWIKGSDINQDNSSNRLMNLRKKPGGANATNPAWSIEGFGNDGTRGTNMDLRKYSTVQGGGGFTPQARDGSTGALANTGQEELWHHVAFIVANSGYPDDASNDGYSAVYFDGVRTGLDREADQNGLPVGNSDGMLMIGGDESLTNGSRDFVGLLDDVAIFAGVLDGNAIAAIASGALSPDEDLSTASPLTLTRPGSSVAGLVATVDADLSDEATVSVYWGTTDQGATTSGWDSSLPLASPPQAAGNWATSISGLAGETTYFFRFYANDGANEAFSQARTFTTPPINPVPILDDAVIALSGSTLEAEVRTLLGSVDDADSDTADVFVMWGSSDAGPASVPGDWENSASLGTLNFGSNADGTITGLSANETVFFRFYATNANGSDVSDLGTLTTPRETPVLTAYYDFEADGDPFDDPAGDFEDDLTVLVNWAVTSDVASNAKGSSQSADFDGTSYLRTASSTLDLTGDPNGWTVMWWMKATPGDNATNNKSIGTREARTGDKAWSIDNWGGGDDTPQFYYHDKPTSVSTNFNRSLPAAANGTWRHVAVVCSNLGSPDDGGAYLETFVDGASTGRTNGDDSWNAFDISSTGKLSLGNREGSSGVYVGQFDDVALFAGRVSSTDIAAIAGGSLSPADFLEGGSTSVFNTWAASNGVPADSEGTDSDSGGKNNLYEFGLGGNPTNGNDDGALVHAFSAEVDGGSSGPEGVLTMLVRSGASFSASGNDQVSDPVDGIVYTVSADSTVPVGGTVGVSVSGTVVDTGLPAPPAGYEYASFYITGSEGYFQVTVGLAP